MDNWIFYLAIATLLVWGWAVWFSIRENRMDMADLHEKFGVSLQEKFGKIIEESTSREEALAYLAGLMDGLKIGDVPDSDKRDAVDLFYATLDARMGAADGGWSEDDGEYADADAGHPDGSEIDAQMDRMNGECADTTLIKEFED